MTTRYKTHHRVEADGWTTEGSSIAAPETLETIRVELERGPIIVEHWHDRGARAAERLVFDDDELFCDYLVTRALAGDAIDVWAWEALYEGRQDDAHAPSTGFPASAPAQLQPLVAPQLLHL